MKDNLENVASPSGLAGADSRASDISKAVRATFKLGNKRRAFVLSDPPFPKVGSNVTFEGQDWICTSVSKTTVLLTGIRKERKAPKSLPLVPTKSPKLQDKLQVNPEGVR